jgi:hypothetical protein
VEIRKFATFRAGYATPLVPNGKPTVRCTPRGAVTLDRNAVADHYNHKACYDWRVELSITDVSQIVDLVATEVLPKHSQLVHQAMEDQVVNLMKLLAAATGNTATGWQQIPSSGFDGSVGDVPVDSGSPSTVPAE